MKFGIIGPTYTPYSNTMADEELINWIIEAIETPGAQTKWSLIGSPGLALAYALPKSPTRESCDANGRIFEAAGDTLYELFADGTFTARATISGSGPVSIAASNIELLIVAGGQAWCYELATDTVSEVTSDLAGVPIQVVYSDGYFIVCFQNSNKFQISDILDGTTWPGIQVNAVSVFPENVIGLQVSHRELWVRGAQHIQPYQDTGSDEVFDVIPGALIETGDAATFGMCLLDNTPFWISQDARGARQAWRASGYTPQRISTHAVEFALSNYTADQITNLVTYSYQDGGHLFWVLYIPGTEFSFAYDVATGMWGKRSTDIAGVASSHLSWNHVYAFGKHLVGDWNSGNVYEMKLAYDTGGNVYAFVTDNGTLIRRKRRAPIVVSEMVFIYHNQLVLDFATGLGPQPPLQDGDGNDRPAQAMIRWSDDRGSTWGNEHTLDCGFAGEYKKRAIVRRLGRSRYRVYELTVSDPIPWILVDAYLEAA